MTTITAETDLNEAARIIHAANAKWWQDIDTGEPLPRNPKELLALVISEISECLEGERKNLRDDKLVKRQMAEVEMADTYIRLLDFSGGFKIPLAGHLRPYTGPIADNKGEAMFDLMVLVTCISEYGHSWLEVSLGYIEGYCTKHGYDLWGALNEKMEFNRTRIDHTHEARRIAGGKQF